MTAMHNAYAATILGFIHVMRRYQNRDAFIGEVIYQIPEISAGYGINTTGGLIEE
jgi:hypothetical protein